MPDPQLLVLRTAPSSDVAWPPETTARRIFLHGDAVARAETSPPDGVLVLVCSTSWRRRFGERRPAGSSRLATLTSLVDTLAQGLWVRSSGLGGEGPLGRGKPLLLEVGFVPATEWQRKEALELVLALAAFEFEAEVVFVGAGTGHLHGPTGRGWRQLTDFGMMTIRADSGAAGELPGVGALSGGRLDRLRKAAGLRLVL